MSDPAAIIDWLEEERAALALPEPLTVSAWADRYRWVSARTNAAPGPWRTDFVPYTRAPMDAFGEPWVAEITLMWATQSAKTESWLNMLGFLIDHDPLPGSCLVVYPTEPDAQEVCVERIQPMITESDALAKHTSGSPDDLKTLQIRLDRMTVDFTGARSPSGLAAMPRRVLVFDETDKYPPYAGREASPLELGRERQKSFWNRKTINCCSPTTEEGYIYREYLAGSQESYWVPCPHCGHWQVLEFRCVRWPEDERDPERVSSEQLAQYFCPGCGEEIRDAAKPAMLRAGRWVSAKYETIDPTNGKITGERPARLRHRSFRLSSLYAPQLTWSDVAAKFLESKEDPQKLMNFVNGWLGEVWRDRAEVHEESEILALAWELPALVCPEWTAGLTLGIDMQAVGFWFTVWAWSRTLESALIHYGFVPSWTELWALAESVYRVDGSERTLGIWRGALDTGGTRPQDEDEAWSRTEEAYAQLRAFGRNRIWGIKGLAQNRTGQKIRHRILDKTPAGKRIPGGLVIFLLDSSALRDDFYWRLGVGTVLCRGCGQAVPARALVCEHCSAPLPVREQQVHLHAGVGTDFAAHVLGVEKRRNRAGAYEWVKVRQHDLLDASVYAHACADAQWWGGVGVLRGPQALTRGPDEGAPAGNERRPEPRIPRMMQRARLA